MPTALLNLLTLMCLSLAVVTATAGCEEPPDRSLQPPERELPEPQETTPASPVTTSATPSAAGGAARREAVVQARTPAEHRKAAEAGDVSSMLILGRSYESLGQASEARQWYQRAADAGSEEGKQALAAIDAPATRPLSSAAGAATSPDDLARTGESAEAGEATRRRVPVAPLPPGEPGKLRWVDLAAILNYEDMITQTREVPVPPNEALAPGATTTFVGVTSSRDAGIVVAAMGATENELVEVSTIVRIRNKVDPGSSPRVGQAGAVAARVTSNNVNQREFLEWITHYLQTEQRSEPIFRNGWRITITGFAAEGKPDPKPHVGTAVIIEMKK